MSGTVVLLGHGKKTGLVMARALIHMGYVPVVFGWNEFSPRVFGRKRPCLVLADMDHPEANPMEHTCHVVRKQWGRTVPVVAVSESAKFGVISALLDGGADAVLPANAPLELVERKLAKCLRETNADDGVDEDAVPPNLSRLFTGNSGLIRLGDIVQVYAGAAPRQPAFRRMAPPDQEWRGVITSHAVDRFYAGKPDAYLRWSRFHLFRLPQPGEYSVREKVLLRRAGPPLAAAVDKSGSPAGADVYSLVPAEDVGAGFVCCLLNSRLLDFYFNRIAKLDSSGRLRLEDIRETPIPRPTAAAIQELSRCAALLAHFGPTPQSAIDRQSKDQIWAQMEETVFSLYGANYGVRSSLAAMHF